ncbi:TIGR03086 family metal-binding protein [Streptomyces sp. HNM0574]|uniref:TIGR03086 family metal-binding protein n=1 Tax=Streptomyces sp. HNM0574 TaxID=2714954 RepID=UPI00146B004A|nr:TIGR03086 family metal-binding protein [Streptomyces sp. HNM0574]NLU70831.1 TIGR03086 family protein [Streptomyces sp. HNM0574]
MRRLLPETDTALLERAVGYALCAVRPVTRAVLTAPTPCRRWDLEALLRHTNDSLTALSEGLGDGRVPLPAGPNDRTEAGSRTDPAEVFRLRATRLLEICAGGPGGFVEVADLPLTAAAVVRTGALEIAVHAWDIAQAAGLPRPVPPRLATALLRTARQLVPAPYARPPLFAPPVTVPAEADPSDRLIAFLGRDPRHPVRDPQHP